MPSIQWYPHARILSGYDSDTQHPILPPTHPFVHVRAPENQIGDEGARALADGMKGLKELKQLGLSGEWCYRLLAITHSCPWHTHMIGGCGCGCGVRMGCRVVYACECECSFW